MTATPLTPLGLGPKRAEIRGRVAELKRLLVELADDMTKAHNDYAYLTPEFMWARDFVESAWRNLEFAEQHFRD